MTDDTLVRLAREAGLTDPDLKPWMTDYGNAKEAIKRFAALVRAEALEDAARICEAQGGSGSVFGHVFRAVTMCAAAIRALKDKP